MSISDLGIYNHGTTANEESLSNQSGDTFLLTDDESSQVFSYADILQRQEQQSQQRVPVPSAPPTDSFLSAAAVL